MHNFGLGANQSYGVHLIEHTPKHILSNLAGERYSEKQIKLVHCNGFKKQCLVGFVNEKLGNLN